VHCRGYVDCIKKNLKDKRQRKCGFPLNLGDFPLETIKPSPVMVRFMKSVYNNISQNFSNIYQRIPMSYHGTMTGFMFSRHVIHFLQLKNQQMACSWLTLVTHISLKSLPIHRKRDENLLNTTNMIF
jgi:hypothetical protein